MTIAEKLLLAGLSLREKRKTFSAEDLVVRAWEMYPDTFGLAGYDYPDSNRVLTNIMGTKGLRGKGWVQKVGTKQYRITSKGRSDAAALMETSGKKSEQRVLRSELRREAGKWLDELVSTTAAQKVLNDKTGPLTFYDACGFWGITARSNANTLNERLKRFDTMMTEAEGALEKNNEAEGLKLSSRVVTKSEMQTLQEAHEEMQKQFSTELDVIRRRTDERKRR